MLNFKRNQTFFYCIVFIFYILYIKYEQLGASSSNLWVQNDAKKVIINLLSIPFDNYKSIRNNNIINAICLDLQTEFHLLIKVELIHLAQSLLQCNFKDQTIDHSFTRRTMWVRSLLMHSQTPSIHRQSLVFKKLENAPSNNTFQLMQIQ